MTGLCFDAQGKPWCVTDNGISVFDQDKWMAFTDTEGLPKNEVSRLVSGRDGLHVCTRGGMTVLALMPKMPDQQR
ncbi:hypothetical protein L0337_34815 [candidate division KSB1 bacterium]|nr:hypothetical protein [candidate division KSB1 bacterium]